MAITRGWHGLGEISVPMPLACSRQAPVNDMVMLHRDIEPFDYAVEVEDAAPPVENRAPRRQPADISRLLSRARASGRPTGASVRPLDRLIALQRADGSWVLDGELAKALGWRSAKQLLKALGRTPSGEPEKRAAATALAVVWLERECQDARDEWQLLAEKAREWLSRTPEGIDTWLALAGDTLARR